MRAGRFDLYGTIPGPRRGTYEIVRDVREWLPAGGSRHIETVRTGEVLKGREANAECNRRNGALFLRGG